MNSPILLRRLKQADSEEAKQAILRAQYFDDLFTAKKVMNENYIELKSDILRLVRELSGQTLDLFDETRSLLAGDSGIDISQQSDELRELLDKANRDLLALSGDPNRKDAGALGNFVTYSRRLRDKLLNFALIERTEKR